MDLLGSWARSLRAANRSPRTIEAYLADAELFTSHIDGVDPLNARRSDVKSFLASQYDKGLADATVARRYRSLLQFFRWAEDEGEIDFNPMAKMKPPKVAEVPPPIIRDEQFAKLRGLPRGARQRRTTTHATQQGDRKQGPRF
jgi:site-specific recombinase XerD